MSFPIPRKFRNEPRYGGIPGFPEILAKSPPGKLWDTQGIPGFSKILGKVWDTPGTPGFSQNPGKRIFPGVPKSQKSQDFTPGKGLGHPGNSRISQNPRKKNLSGFGTPRELRMSQNLKNPGISPLGMGFGGSRCPKIPKIAGKSLPERVWDTQGTPGFSQNHGKIIPRKGLGDPGVPKCPKIPGFQPWG